MFRKNLPRLLYTDGTQRQRIFPAFGNKQTVLSLAQVNRKPYGSALIPSIPYASCINPAVLRQFIIRALSGEGAAQPKEVYPAAVSKTETAGKSPFYYISPEKRNKICPAL